MMPELNIDLGEHDDEPAELYRLAHRVNVACGGHAGDAASMARACRLARAQGALVGAHPSFEDREGFGRVAQALAPEALRAGVARQCESLRAAAAAAGVVVSHLKPHGALYHAADRDPLLAKALIDGAVDVFGALAIVGPPDGALAAHARSRGLPFLREGFRGSLNPPSRSPAERPRDHASRRRSPVPACAPPTRSRWPSMGTCTSSLPASPSTCRPRRAPSATSPCPAASTCRSFSAVAAPSSSPASAASRDACSGKGDLVPAALGAPAASRSVSTHFDFEASLRLIPGPDAFDEESLALLFGATFRVSTALDRVGLRLEGPRFVSRPADRRISMPMVRGALQITADGTPIVLGPDHPTTDGYRVIACAATVDLGNLAARRPGTDVRFVRA